MFNSHVEIDRSLVFGASLRTCDLSTRYDERRSVKLFGHSRILCIFSSLKYFDYSPFSLPFFPLLVPALSPTLSFIHAYMHAYTYILSLPLFSLSLSFSPSVYFKRLIRKSTDTHSQREKCCVLKKNNLHFI